MELNSDLERLRERAIEELRRATGPLPTGMLAVTLGVATHRVQLALYVPLQRGDVSFSDQGWFIADAEDRPTFDENQAQLNG